jgi:predicted GTPase
LAGKSTQGDDDEEDIEGAKESTAHNNATAVNGHQSNGVSEADFALAEAEASAHKDGGGNEVDTREAAKSSSSSSSSSSSGWRAPPQVDSVIELAIVGRPNVGKSSLVS